MRENACRDTAQKQTAQRRAIHGTDDQVRIGFTRRREELIGSRTAADTELDGLARGAQALRRVLQDALGQEVVPRKMRRNAGVAPSSYCGELTVGVGSPRFARRGSHPVAAGHARS